MEFDQKSHLARRTAGGNTTSVTIPDCARDPLVFLYYFRNQLAKGSPIDTATFFSGPGRSLEILSAGKDNVTFAGKSGHRKNTGSPIAVLMRRERLKSGSPRIRFTSP